MRDPRTIAGRGIAAALAATMACTGLAACGAKKDAPADSGQTQTDKADAVADAASKGTDAAADAGSDATSPQAQTPTPTQAAHVYDYTPGTVGTVLADDGQTPLVPDFSIPGMILRGNRQDETNATDLAGAYRLTGLKSDYYFNEWIEFYIDPAGQPPLPTAWKVACLPHREMDEYKALSGAQIEELANASYGFVIDMGNQPQSIDETSGKAYFGNGYVNADANLPGIWDLLFLKDGRPAQYMTINLSTAPTA